MELIVKAYCPKIIRILEEVEVVNTFPDLFAFGLIRIAFEITVISQCSR